MRKSLVLATCLVALLTAAGAAKSKWTEQRSPHFLIYYQQVPQDFIDNVAEVAERFYDEITSDLGFTRYRGWTYDERAKIYIYDDQEDYVKNARQKSWSSGMAYVRQKEIHTFPSAHGFFDSTLPHELGHIIFREFIGPTAVIPMWLEEGVAMYQEKGKRWGANKVVRDAMAAGKFLTLKQLSAQRFYHNSDRDLVDLFYAEAASVVYFLMTEFGPRRFVDLCEALRDGEPFEKALAASYSHIDSVEDLNDLWVSYLKDQ